MVFDSTVRRELARGFAATLVVILTIVITMLLIRTVGQAAKGQVSPQDVVLLLGYVTLANLPLMLALSLFVAIVVSLGRMYRDSEMVIWFASGVSLARFVRPVLRGSWPAQLVIVALVLVAVPWSNRNVAELRERYEQRSDLSRVSPGVFQASSDGRRVFFIERRADEAGDARNVFVLSSIDGVESVVSAREGRLEADGDDRWLVLSSGQRNDVDGRSGEKTQARFEDYRVLADERISRQAGELPPKATDTLDLLRDPGLPSRAELGFRVGLALGAVNLMLLGIGLSAAQPRRASNWNLLFALLSFVVYYNLINISQAWVAAGRIGLGTSLVALHGAAFGVALALIAWRDHATVWSLRRPRGATPAPAAA
jgi:lipopolysaccharide export system permease protein